MIELNNVLVDKLPTEWEAPDGNVYQIDTDFRIGIQICLVQDDTELTKREKTAKIIELLFLGKVPQNPQDIEECAAFFANGWFHDNESKDKAQKRLMDFNVDQWRIYSAFLAQYRIDLDTIEYLHFWKFMGLLSSLEECSYTRVIGIRQRKFKPKMDPEDRKQLKKAKEVYELPQIRSLEEQEMDADIYDFLGGTISEAEQKRLTEFEKYADMEEEEE